MANGTPILAKALLGDRLARPFDGGAVFVDGRPLFGLTKTIRGILVSLVALPHGLSDFRGTLALWSRRWLSPATFSRAS